jgi:hypothetical protein
VPCSLYGYESALFGGLLHLFATVFISCSSNQFDMMAGEGAKMCVRGPLQVNCSGGRVQVRTYKHYFPTTVLCSSLP